MWKSGVLFRGSQQRFLCNPMLNSASDLLGSRVKPVCFSCLYFCCTPQKNDDSAWLFRYLSLKAQCTRLLGGVTSSSRQLTPSKDADVWRGNAYERKTGKKEGRFGTGRGYDGVWGEEVVVVGGAGALKGRRRRGRKVEVKCL